MADRRFLRLPDSHLASYVFALMYAAESRSDGVLEDGDLEVIPRYKQDSTAILVQHGLLEPAEGGAWILTDYAATQTSAADLRAQEERRLRAREKKRNQRSRAAPSAESAPPEPVVTDWDTATIPE